MAAAIYSVSYKLKKSASVPDFLAAAKKLNDEYISKQKGYVSWKQCVDKEKETWADFATFETMEDAQNFLEGSKNPNEVALAFYAFLNMPSCRSNLYSVEKMHE